MNNTFAILSWTLLALSIGACVGVFMFAQHITYESEARVFSVQNIEQVSAKQMSALRLRTLAAETATERAEFERLLNVDVIGLATTIESAGAKAGVTVRISDALPERIANPDNVQGADLQSVGFIIEANGSFTALMRVVAAFERLALPSSIEQVELERLTGTSEGTWRLSARLRTFTTAAIRS